MRTYKLFHSTMLLVFVAEAAQAKISCDEFKTKVNEALQEAGKTSVEWEPMMYSKGFKSINPTTAGIQIGIGCNHSGELVDLGASNPLHDDEDKAAEPIFVRGMLQALDPKMTKQNADGVLNNARQRLLKMSGSTGTHRVSVAGYNVVFWKGPTVNGGVRFRYDIKP